jgi:CxxC-x17-CxxC domain-containing protein
MPGVYWPRPGEIDTRGAVLARRTITGTTWNAADHRTTKPEQTRKGGEGDVTFTDKVLVCRECGASFIFTSGEQEFFAMKGLQNEPGRCTDCRSIRRQQRDSGGGSMGDYRPRREMHDAVCAQCGQTTQVPFLPRGDRPVYCSTCFEQVRSVRR